MPAVVECECGRRFRAKDELRGRTVACPGCGANLTVPMAVAPLSKPPATLPRSGPKSAGKGAFGYPQRTRPQTDQKDAPRFSISGKQIAFIAVLIIIPTIIWLGKIGPVAAMNRWQAEEADYDSDIRTTYNRFMYQYREKQGADLSEARFVPHVKGLLIDAPIMMFKFPTDVAFQGDTTEGRFFGRYTFDTRRVTGTLEIDGQTIPIDAIADDKETKFLDP